MSDNNTVPVSPSVTHIPDLTANIRQLLQPTLQVNPQLHAALSQIVDMASATKQLVDPTKPTTTPVTTPGTNLNLPASPATFTYSFTPNNLLLFWTENDASAINFEIREVSGTPDPDNNVNWTNGQFVTRTPGLSAAIAPLLSGSYLYLIKAINSLGQYSQFPTVVTVIVPVLSPPTLSVTVIDNNVLLNWTPPSSTWAISAYNVYQTNPALQRTLIGTFSGTFTSIFETAQGQYVFEVQAIDIAGNVSASAVFTVNVNPPPNFNIFDKRLSGLGGTITNGLLSGGKIIYIMDLTETWSTHFSNRGWNSPQDQVNAGYPDYIEPGIPGNTGGYQEIVDYGQVFNNVVSNVTWSVDQITGGVTVTPYLSASIDGINYTAEIQAPATFFAQVRFLKVRFVFTPDNVAPSDDDFINFYNLTFILSVSQTVDSGQVLANANDPSPGTIVNFNKAFKYVDSITLDVGIGSPVTPIWNFTFPPNPTSFNVMVFDSKGKRVNQLVTWHAKGVL